MSNIGKCDSAPLLICPIRSLVRSAKVPRLSAWSVWELLTLSLEHVTICTALRNQWSLGFEQRKCWMSQQVCLLDYDQIHPGVLQGAGSPCADMLLCRLLTRMPSQRRWWFHLSLNSTRRGSKTSNAEQKHLLLQCPMMSHHVPWCPLYAEQPVSAAAPQPRPNEEKKPSKIPSGDACGPCVSSNFLRKQQRNQKTRISGFLRNCLWGTLARHTLELSLSFGANLIDWQRVYRILYTVYHLNVGLHWSQTQANFSPAETSAYASAS